MCACVKHWLRLQQQLWPFIWHSLSWNLDLSTLAIGLTDSEELKLDTWIVAVQQRVTQTSQRLRPTVPIVILTISKFKFSGSLNLPTGRLMLALPCRACPGEFNHYLSNDSDSPGHSPKFPKRQGPTTGSPTMTMRAGCGCRAARVGCRAARAGCRAARSGCRAAHARVACRSACAWCRDDLAGHTMIHRRVLGRHRREQYGTSPHAGLWRHRCCYDALS